MGSAGPRAPPMAQRNRKTRGYHYRGLKAGKRGTKGVSVFSAKSRRAPTFQRVTRSIEKKKQNKHAYRKRLSDSEGSSSSSCSVCSDSEQDTHSVTDPIPEVSFDLSSPEDSRSGGSAPRGAQKGQKKNPNEARREAAQQNAARAYYPPKGLVRKSCIGQKVDSNKIFRRVVQQMRGGVGVDMSQALAGFRGKSLQMGRHLLLANDGGRRRRALSRDLAASETSASDSESTREQDPNNAGTGSRRLGCFRRPCESMQLGRTLSGGSEAGAAGAGAEEVEESYQNRAGLNRWVQKERLHKVLRLLYPLVENRSRNTTERVAEAEARLERVLAPHFSKGATTTDCGKNLAFFAVQRQEQDGDSVRAHELKRYGGAHNRCDGAGACEILYLLLQLGVEMDLRDRNGQTPLFYAARDANVEAVLFLLNDCGADPTVLDVHGQTALFYAATGAAREKREPARYCHVNEGRKRANRRRFAVIATLVEAGCDPLVVDTRTRQEALDLVAGANTYVVREMTSLVERCRAAAAAGGAEQQVCGPLCPAWHAGLWSERKKGSNHLRRKLAEYDNFMVLSESKKDDEEFVFEKTPFLHMSALTGVGADPRRANTKASATAQFVVEYSTVGDEDRLAELETEFLMDHRALIAEANKGALKGEAGGEVPIELAAKVAGISPVPAKRRQVIASLCKQPSDRLYRGCTLKVSCLDVYDLENWDMLRERRQQPAAVRNDAGPRSMCGYVFVKNSSDEDDYYELSHLKVANSHGRLGIASALFCGMLNHLKEHEQCDPNLEDLRLSVVSGNGRACGLYDKLEFLEMGESTKRPYYRHTATGEFACDPPEHLILSRPDWLEEASTQASSGMDRTLSSASSADGDFAASAPLRRTSSAAGGGLVRTVSSAESLGGGLVRTTSTGRDGFGDFTFTASVPFGGLCGAGPLGPQAAVDFSDSVAFAASTTAPAMAGIPEHGAAASAGLWDFGGSAAFGGEFGGASHGLAMAGGLTGSGDMMSSAALGSLSMHGATSMGMGGLLASRPMEEKLCRRNERSLKSPEEQERRAELRKLCAGPRELRKHCKAKCWEFSGYEMCWSRYQRVRKIFGAELPACAR